MTTHILLTGGTRGIGAAIAQSLDNPDIRLIATGSKDADLSNPAAALGLWQRALEALDGRIDVLINNAGIFEKAPIDDPDEAWLAAYERSMAINLTASTLLSRAAVQHFRSRPGGGRIVNVASRAAYRGDGPDYWHYAASKGGMVAVTKTIARAYAAEGIYAFAICPGFTMTGMAEDYLESRGGSALLADIPLGRVATPEEIATIARFCALEAPPSMTSTIIDANGASYVR